MSGVSKGVVPAGRPYNLHRVIEPQGVYPQQAWRIDNSDVLFDNEIHLACDSLYLEAASFTQLREEAGDDESRMAEAIMEIVSERGKLHNPNTDTGGVMLGHITAMGPACKRHARFRPGDRVGCLTSLTQIPLHIDEITQIDLDRGVVRVKGRAVAPDLGVLVEPPKGLSEALQLRMFEVAGIAPHVASLVRPGMQVIILGVETPTGLLAAYAARAGVGDQGQVLAIVSSEAAMERLTPLEEDGIALRLIPLEESVALTETAEAATNGDLFDLTVHCADAPGTELSAIAVTRPKGTIVFFSMATRFGAAAIAGEAFAREQELIIGKGYVAGHVGFSSDLIRRYPRLKAALTGPS